MLIAKGSTKFDCKYKSLILYAEVVNESYFVYETDCKMNIATFDNLNDCLFNFFNRVENGTFNLLNIDRWRK